jgi:hypothetical protein
MKTFRITVLIFLIPAFCYSQGRFDFRRIEDNSFLIEEAYNQETGVIQHISAFQWLQNKTWIYTFTEEWPMKGQKHQISFTLPVLNPGSAGLGDIALNYRYQAALGERLAFSPRISLLLPTGDAGKATGNGVPGYQFDLPLSFIVSRKLVTHYNLGSTFIFSAKDAQGLRSDIININYGFSIIYLLMENLNLMLEIAGNSIRTKPENSRVLTNSLLYINPGCRVAFNFNSGLQIVPGVAFPIGTGGGKGDNGIFLYLSFEHPVHSNKPAPSGQ